MGVATKVVHHGGESTQGESSVLMAHVEDIMGSHIGHASPTLDPLVDVHGEFTPCQFEHHVRPKFATPILHVINNFKNYEFFPTYT